MKYVWPILILLVAATATTLLFLLRPEPDVEEPARYVPAVNTVTATPESVRLTVHTQGTVEPRSATTLTAEVGGRILWVADFFEAGGFFSEGDILLRIDPIPYEAALAEAQAALAGARLALEQERVMAEQARHEWEEHGGREPTPLVLRQPQLEKARADLAAAEARVRIAERNLEHTRIRAPYDGRLREQLADLGQVVAPNSTPLARVYAIDYAEVRLPISLHQADKLNLPESSAAENTERVPARFHTRLNNSSISWHGEIVRTEGTIDPRTRMLTAVGRIAHPYHPNQDNGTDKPPLRVGQFVEAELIGIMLEKAFRIPRQALVDETTVRIVDAENRLRSRKVVVRHTTPDYAVITDGIDAGDRINLTPLDFFIEGMSVAPAPDTETETLP